MSKTVRFQSNRRGIIFQFAVMIERGFQCLISDDNWVLGVTQGQLGSYTENGFLGLKHGFRI